MKRKCEDCGEEFEGGKKARFCLKCRKLRYATAWQHRTNHNGERKPVQKKSRFSCDTCAKRGTRCNTSHRGTHKYCWVSADGKTALEIL